MKFHGSVLKTQGNDSGLDHDLLLLEGSETLGWGGQPQDIQLEFWGQ